MPRMLLIIVQQNENHQGATWQSMPLFEGSHTNMDNALDRFLQICICRLHGKLGKELVVPQCFWSLAHYHNKALFGYLNKPGKLALCKSHSNHSGLILTSSLLQGPWTILVEVLWPSEVLPPSHLYSSSTRFLSPHLPHIFPLQSSCSFPSHQVSPTPPPHLLTSLSLLLGQRFLQHLPSLPSVFTCCTRWGARHAEDPKEHSKHQRNNHAPLCAEARQDACL